MTKQTTSRLSVCLSVSSHSPTYFIPHIHKTLCSSNTTSTSSSIFFSRFLFLEIIRNTNTIIERMLMEKINNVGGGRELVDTTLTKVFVGGLAWETQKDAVKEHFDKYGEILEAVIIFDKHTGRSKGYGFVTFKEPEAAKKACEDATPMINGRRANCNLASLGARQPRPAVTNSPTPQKGSNLVPRSVSPAPVNPVQWYYPVGTRTAAPFQQHHQQPISYSPYGYSPAYFATNMSYTPKISYNGGSYVTGNNISQPQMYAGQGMVPMYQLYHLNQQQMMGVPAHVYPSSAYSPMSTIPAIISKPPTMAPNTGTWVQVKVFQPKAMNSYL